MRKFTVVLAASALFLGVMASTATAAAPKVGSTCSNVGAFFETPNKRFVCKKEGKKKVWRIWNSTPQATPSAAPTPTPIATPTPTKSSSPVVIPIPITLPVAQGSITFANILDNVEKVAQVAYESAQKIYSSNKTPTGMKSTIWVGPTTVPVGSMSEEERIVKAMKLWSGYNQPKSIGLYFFNTQDEPLAEIAYAKWRTENKITAGPPASKMRNDCLSNNGPGAPEASTEPLQDCTGANAGVIDSIGTGMGWFGVPTEAGPRSDTYRLGAIEIHEFTHMVQTAQFVGTSQQPGQAMQNISPCWLQEGQAHFAGKTVASASYSDYLNQRNGEALNRKAANNLLAPRDLAGVSAYLSLETLQTCQSTYSWGYATGLLAVEALSAIGGATSTMALYALEARGHTFSEAFKMVYGISWEKAQPILVQVIVKDYLVASMNG
ncbi:MAG: hypothetical protein F2690_03800 [Actinobacteria bacterium]|uniref:Unannotated protein n=1 Tax=freshwater metagenome TaxID=449393 RepID=A0A6J7MYU9_9ZZZZ|nr:hypothetical protein [Actinomycetota bacterium]MSX71793.1 hypothetical protein [Actinomycetota bacterium]MSY69674.1 hypothetical protein [Actinomycetota bacterium]